MKNNKEIIKSYANFNTILNIKYKICLSDINNLNKKILKIKNVYNEIQNCLFSKYKFNIINKINGKLSSTFNKNHIIIFDQCDNLQYLISNEYSNLINSNNDFTIISNSNEKELEILELLAKKKCNVINKFQITEPYIKNDIICNALLNVVTNIANNVKQIKGYKEIYLFLQLSNSNRILNRIFPIEKKLNTFFCNKFHSNIELFFPTKKIWADHTYNQFIHFYILINIFAYQKERMLIKSKELRENIEALDEKINELVRKDKINKSLEISDELNIIQESQDENN